MIPDSDKKRPIAFAFDEAASLLDIGVAEFMRLRKNE